MLGCGGGGGGGGGGRWAVGVGGGEVVAGLGGSKGLWEGKVAVTEGEAVAVAVRTVAPPPRRPHHHCYGIAAAAEPV